MRLDESYRKCVVLIGVGPVGSDDEIEPWGTGFIVANNVDGRDAYLVTAAHVVIDMGDAPFDVRFNKQGGGAKNYRIEHAEWFFHPTDKAVDVAVHPVEVPAWADCARLARSPNLFEEGRFESKDIGAGNRTYTVGLWKFLHGDRRNQPFVYSGHIGLVPEDQRVPVDRWQAGQDDPVLVEAYLVEGQPLDGASGSPVFVRRTIPRPIVKRDNTQIDAYMEGSVWLLGLLSDLFTAKVGPPARQDFVVPRGVNVVVPSKKILEVLDHPDLVTRRNS